MSCTREAFLAWCEAAGVEMAPEVSVQPIDGAGLGLVVGACSLASGSLVVRVPLDAAVSVAGQSREGGGIEPSLAPLVGGLDRANALALLICVRTDAEDCGRGELGPWAALWPEDAEGGWGITGAINEINWWPELSQIHGEQEAAAHRAFTGTVLPAFQASTGGQGLTSQPPTWERFKWACSVVSSRAVAVEMWGETQPTLVPLLDLLNHRPSGEASCAISFIHDSTGDAFVVRTTRGVAASEELSISYGRKDNAELLAGYGFCLRDNPHDSLLLRVPMGASAGDPMAAQRLALLPRGVGSRNHGIASAGCAGGDDGSPEWAWGSISWETGGAEDADGSEVGPPAGGAAPARRPCISRELLLLLSVAAASSIPELFAAVTVAGDPPTAAWALLSACCNRDLAELPSDETACSTLAPWPSLASMAVAALEARRALLQHAKDVAEHHASQASSAADAMQGLQLVDADALEYE